MNKPKPTYKNMKFNINKEDYERSDTTNDSLIYGEVNYNDIYKLLVDLNIDLTGKILLDIGSGCGNLLYGLSKINDTIEYHGIEIEKHRYERSTCFENDSEQLLCFKHGDYNTIYFGLYDIIYCCNTVFTDEENNRLYNKLIFESKTGYYVILFGHHKKLMNYLLFHKYVKTSWSDCVNVYVYFIK